MQACVYILASQPFGTLYVGVTSDLVQRVWQHREGLVEGFTREHDVHLLVWYELHATMDAAFTREKRIEEWRREWKIRLIESENPEWDDRYSSILA